MSFLGVLFAFGALFGWATGDFFIQRTTRAVGITKSLFYIGLVGAVALLPFVYSEVIPSLSDRSQWPLLISVCVIVVLAAFSNFQGLKKGKLSVVLPLTGLELPVTIALTTFLGHEILSPHIYLLMGATAIGIFLTTIVSLRDFRGLRFESGTLFALGGAIGLGVTNYLVGQASRAYSPLFTLWLTHTVACLVAAALLYKTGILKPSLLLADLKKHTLIITLQSLLDNFAWLSYAYATTLIPIGIAATISESFIVVGTLFGVIFNKEKLKTHQIIGITIALAGVLALAAMAE
ncbi:MAG: DMT family transporter [Patescibacteria group bacterium]|nr:DMT family transporter [Patescibacteria group bacterium]